MSKGGISSIRLCRSGRSRRIASIFKNDSLSNGLQSGPEDQGFKVRQKNRIATKGLRPLSVS